MLILVIGRCLAARRFSGGFGKELLGFDFVTPTIDWGDEVIFTQEIDKHGKIFVVHDDNRTVVVGHELELHVVGVIDEFVLGHFFGNVEGLEFFDEGLFVLEQSVEG